MHATASSLQLGMCLPYVIDLTERSGINNLFFKDEIRNNLRASTLISSYI